MSVVDCLLSFGWSMRVRATTPTKESRLHGKGIRLIPCRSRSVGGGEGETDRTITLCISLTLCPGCNRCFWLGGEANP